MIERHTDADMHDGSHLPALHSDSFRCLPESEPDHGLPYHRKLPVARYRRCTLARRGVYASLVDFCVSPQRAQYIRISQMPRTHNAVLPNRMTRNGVLYQGWGLARGGSYNLR